MWDLIIGAVVNGDYQMYAVIVFDSFDSCTALSMLLEDYAVGEVVTICAPSDY